MARGLDEFRQTHGNRNRAESSSAQSPGVQAWEEFLCKRRKIRLLDFTQHFRWVRGLGSSPLFFRPATSRRFLQGATPLLAPELSRGHRFEHGFRIPLEVDAERFAVGRQRVDRRAVDARRGAPKKQVVLRP